MALFVALSATSPVNACSFFMIHDGTQVLAGNNEDYWDSDTWVWYVPADKTKHGCVFLGYGNRSPQGGMNDQGLFFDYAATDLNPITDHKRPANGKKYPAGQVGQGLVQGDGETR